MNSSIEKQSQRFEFLKLVFNETQGHQNKLVNMWDIGEKLNLDRQTTEVTIQYLVGEGLIKTLTFGGGISIIHLGIKEIEQVTIHSEPTKHFPDVFNMSGDFRGAVINIQSNLMNVTQKINTLSVPDSSIKSELNQLITELGKLLQTVPSERIDDAEAVAWATESLLETVTVEKPNKTKVAITKEGLIQAAKNISKVLPSILPIIEQIISVVERIRS